MGLDLDKEETVPNIMIYGFPGELQCARTRSLICDAVQELDLDHEAVITVIPSVVSNCDGSDRRAEYIHVFSTKPEQIKSIIAALKKRNLGLDTETPTAFYDATNMESETGPVSRAQFIECLLNANPQPVSVPREVRKGNLDKLPLGILRELAG
jgi:hypothetical protein